MSRDSWPRLAQWRVLRVIVHAKLLGATVVTFGAWQNEEHKEKTRRPYAKREQRDWSSLDAATALLRSDRLEILTEFLGERLNLIALGTRDVEIESCCAKHGS